MSDQVSKTKNRYRMTLAKKRTFLKCLVPFLLFIIPIGLQAQSIPIDSIKKTLKLKLADTVRANNLEKLSVAYTKKNTDSALFFAQQFMDLSTKRNNVDFRIRALFQFGRIYRKEKNYPLAIQKDSLARLLARKIGDTENEVNSLMYLALSHLGNDDQSLAFDYFNRALSVKESYKNTNEQVIAHMKVASQYLDLQKYDIALKFLLPLLEKMDNKDLSVISKIRLYNWIGGIYKEIGELEKSITFFENVIHLSREESQYRELIIGSLNLAGVFRISGDSEKALKLAFDALDVSREQNHLFEQNILKSIGYSYSELKEYDNAEGYFLQAAELVKKDGTVYDIINANCSLGEFYVKVGKFDKGKRLLERSKEDFSKLDNLRKSKNLISQIYKSLSKIDSGRNDYKSSLYHYKKHIELKDSIALDEQKQEIANLEIAYESDKKDREIRLLSTKNEVQRLKAGQDRNLRIGLAIGGALALLLLGVTYSKYRAKKRALTTIAEQKTAIEEKSRENEMLVREIHHRVKNNLQITSSLLNAHAHSSKHDARVDQIIQESQNRIRSMALIHQNLYSSNNFSKVETTNYFNDLIDNLRESYVHERKNVRFESDIQPGEIKMDLAVPLGLMLNELVTNAFKYAFREPRVDATITIDFKMGQEGKSFDLKVSDNGSGMPDGFDMDASGSFGLQMVRGLVVQLKGNIVLEQTNGQGTCFHISVNYPQAA